MSGATYLRVQATRGARICAGHELRITRRCLVDDLLVGAETPFTEIAGHEIVRAFVNRRSDRVIDTRQVSPLTSGKIVYRLGYGDRHRGATWHDEKHGVVWLCAYGQHDFEDEGDAFPYFKTLDRAGELLPAEADYIDLFRERDMRLTLAMQTVPAELLASARREPETEHSDVVGGVPVSVVVVRVDSLEEVSVAIDTRRNLTQEALVMILAALFPDSEASQLEHPASLPTRELHECEVCFRHCAEI